MNAWSRWMFRRRSKKLIRSYYAALEDLLNAALPVYGEEAVKRVRGNVRAILNNHPDLETLIDAIDGELRRAFPRKSWTP